MEIELKQVYSFHQPGQQDNQEDARFPDSNEPKDCQPFFVVCDGVGGGDKGEVASQSVCKAFGACMNKVDFAQKFSSEDFAKALDHAYNALYKAMKHNSQEMATTLTFICFHAGGVLAAHIGDSRIYHIRPEVGILYRSDDHSLVNALVHSGNVTPEEAENHPQNNYITRSMSYAESKEERARATVMQITDIEANDYFFLCTDGVLHQLNDNQLMKMFSSGLSDKDICQRIAELSEESIDNNTAYIIPIKEVFFDESGVNVDRMAKVENERETASLRTKDESVEVEFLGSSSKDKVSNFLKKLFK